MIHRRHQPINNPRPHSMYLTSPLDALISSCSPMQSNRTDELESLDVVAPSLATTVSEANKSTLDPIL